MFFKTNIRAPTIQFKVLLELFIPPKLQVKPVFLVKNFLEFFEPLNTSYKSNEQNAVM